MPISRNQDSQATVLHPPQPQLENKQAALTAVNQTEEKIETPSKPNEDRYVGFYLDKQMFFPKHLRKEIIKAFSENKDDNSDNECALTQQNTKLHLKIFIPADAKKANEILRSIRIFEEAIGLPIGKAKYRRRNSGEFKKTELSARAEESAILAWHDATGAFLDILMFWSMFGATITGITIFSIVLLDIVATFLLACLSAYRYYKTSQILATIKTKSPNELTLIDKRTLFFSNIAKIIGQFLRGFGKSGLGLIILSNVALGNKISINITLFVLALGYALATAAHYYLFYRYNAKKCNENIKTLTDDHVAPDYDRIFMQEHLIRLLYIALLEQYGENPNNKILLSLKNSIINKPATLKCMVDYLIHGCIYINMVEFKQYYSYYQTIFEKDIEHLEYYIARKDKILAEVRAKGCFSFGIAVLLGLLSLSSSSLIPQNAYIGHMSFYELFIASLLVILLLSNATYEIKLAIQHHADKQQVNTKHVKNEKTFYIKLGLMVTLSLFVLALIFSLITDNKLVQTYSALGIAPTFLALMYSILVRSEEDSLNNQANIKGQCSVTGQNADSKAQNPPTENTEKRRSAMILKNSPEAEKEKIEPGNTTVAYKNDRFSKMNSEIGELSGFAANTLALKGAKKEKQSGLVTGWKMIRSPEIMKGANGLKTALTFIVNGMEQEVVDNLQAASNTVNQIFAFG